MELYNASGTTVSTHIVVACERFNRRFTFPDIILAGISKRNNLPRAGFNGQFVQHNPGK